LTDSLLQGIPKVVVYLDDILITGDSEEEHAKNLQEVLKRLASAGLRLKKEKYKFGVSSVVYLGHKIDATGLHPIPEKVQAIVEAPNPKNVSELKSFLGMLQYYAKLMPNLSSIVNTSAPVVSQEHKVEVGKGPTASIRGVKEASAIIKGFEKELFLACDASPYGLGAVLSHKDQEGTDRLIAYASRSLNAAEKNYSQLDKESLSIMFGIQRFHQYVYRRPFTIITDHKSLISIFNPEKATPSMASARIQRWSLKLAAYNYTL
uniref:ribonuclease H n=1 Tax=Latimeria chalumnae TaxID=7897 RepID=H2ZYP8_LATCH